MGRKIQSVIFDLDGTLVNAYHAVEQSINHTLIQVGLPTVSARLIKRTVGWGDSHLVRKLVGEGRFPKAVKIYRKHHKKALGESVRFLPGAKSLLKFLTKENYRLAIATNRPSKFTDIILRKLEMRPLFEYVLCGDEVKKAKPHPELLLKILKKFSLKPQQALYIGDMMIDIQAGQKAKIKTVAVATGSCSVKELEAYRPHRIINRISDVRKML